MSDTPDLAERIARKMFPALAVLNSAATIRRELRDAPELAQVREALEKIEWTAGRPLQGGRVMIQELAIAALATLDRLAGKDGAK